MTIQTIIDPNASAETRKLTVSVNLFIPNDFLDDEVPIFVKLNDNRKASRSLSVAPATNPTQKVGGTWNLAVSLV